ncbi:hypothetical protein HanRHA438_Chr12g0535601 [Helianthus annuus]|nr:hypothetical protein HanRHA438_Chr12g0535601 [Helianthus annuus]
MAHVNWMDFCDKRRGAVSIRELLLEGLCQCVEETNHSANATLSRFHTLFVEICRFHAFFNFKMAQVTT